MPHDFRTIEQFVQILDDIAEQSLKDRDGFRAVGNVFGEGVNTGRMVLAQRLAATVRTSNIGIVYPPPEQASERPGCGDVIATMNRVYGKMAAPPIPCNRADGICTGGINCERIAGCYSIPRTP